MRRLAPLFLVFVAGCTNAPIAGFLDLVRPSKIGRTAADAAPLQPSNLPTPPPGGQLQLPANPPAMSDGRFMPPLAPRDPSPLPPPAPSPRRDVGPLSLPNT